MKIRLIRKNTLFGFLQYLNFTIQAFVVKLLQNGAQNKQIVNQNFVYFGTK